jgi:hypothetical protein
MDNASSNYSMTHELQSKHEASRIDRPAVQNHLPCMARIIQLAFGAFMSCLGVKRRTKSWNTPQRDQPFDDNESIDIGESQRLQNEVNVRINKVSAMRPGMAKIIQKVHIS